METYKINYKSDFDFFIMAKGSNGKSLSFKDFDWTLTLSTPSSKSAFVASRKGGVLVGCTMNTRLAPRIICDNHGLDIGKVSMELAVEIPDALFPDKSRRIVSKIESGIYLTRGTTEVSHLDFGKRITFTIPINGTDEEPVDPEEPAEPSKPNGGGYMVDNQSLGVEYRRGAMPIHAKEGVWYKMNGHSKLQIRLSNGEMIKLLKDGRVLIDIPQWLHDAFYLGGELRMSLRVYGKEKEINAEYYLDNRTLSLSWLGNDGETIPSNYQLKIFVECKHDTPPNCLVRVVNGKAQFREMSHCDHLPFVAEPTENEILNVLRNGGAFHGKHGIFIVPKNAGRMSPEHVEDYDSKQEKYGGRIHNRYWMRKRQYVNRDRRIGVFLVYRVTRSGRSATSIWSLGKLVGSPQKAVKIS